ncbi:MAG: DUF58 domain-containing protein [Candidatus Binataceae bacterium]
MLAVPSPEAGGPERTAVRPASRLVRLAALIALCALAAVVWHLLVAPALALVAIAAALALLDWGVSRNDPPPRLERILAARMVKGRRAEAVYLLSRPGGLATTVSILDELPAELGGDLLIENVALGAGQRCRLARDLMPLRRGTCELGPTFILWRSRLGLLKFRATAHAGRTVAIIPAASPPARHAALTHRSLRDELGVRPRRARGEGGEFESLREYFHGDDPRHLDWRASARRGRLIVRRYQTERRHTVIVAVDTGRLMAAKSAGDSKLDCALDCAIALARLSGQFGDRVGLLAFDQELRALAKPGSGAAGVGGLVEATLELRPRPFEPNYRVLAETLARHQKKRALVVVLTDFVEGSASRELESYLAVLARRHCVLLVAMRDRLLAELDVREPQIARGRLYRRLALQDLAVEREAALRRIAQFGVQTLDLDPARITAPVLNRYLAIRQAALL